jgi:hypothetical protein
MATIYLPFCLVGMVMMIIALFALISNNTTLQISQQKAMAQTSNNTNTALTHSQASLTTKTIPKSNFLMYENSAAGFRIQYPSNWTKNITNQGITFVLPLSSSNGNGNNGNNVYRFVAKLSVDWGVHQRFPPGMKLKDIASMVINGYQQVLPNFHLILFANTTLGGDPAVKILYMYTDPNLGDLKATDIGSMVNGKIYVIQYYIQNSKYQNYIPILQNIVDSFQFIK